MRAWIVLALLIGAGVFLFLRGGSDVLSGLSTGEIVTAGGRPAAGDDLHHQPVQR